MQGRQPQTDHVQPVKKVLAEGVVKDSLFQVFMGRGNNADIHRDRMRASHRPNLPVLKHPQQFDLDMERHISDFVEKERPIMRGLKKTGITLHCPGEGALDMPEQFRFQKGFGNSRTVDRNKRSLPEIAGFMDGDGQHFLACAAFSTDKHGGIGFCDQLGAGEQFLHHRALTDDILPPFFPILQGVTGTAPRCLNGLFNFPQERSPLDRFGQKRKDTLSRRLDCFRNGAVGRNDDDRNRLVELADRLKQQMGVHRVFHVGFHHEGVTAGLQHLAFFGPFF